MTSPMTSTIIAGHGHGGWGPGPWWPLAWLLFWGLLIAVSVWWWRRRPRGGDAEAVLADRYARGDISDEEYRHRLGILSGRRR